MKRNTLTGLALVAGLALGGCAEEATAPNLLDDALTYHAAIIAADATLEDLALARAPLNFEPGAYLAPGSAPAGRPGGGMGVGGPLSGTRSVTFFDEGGTEQPGYDALTTASIRYVLDVAGDVKRGAWSGSVARTRTMTVSGLLGEEKTRIHDGTGTEKVDRSRTLDDGSGATFSLAGTFAHVGVEVPVPGSESRYPLRGTVTRTLKVAVVNGPKGDVSRDVTVVITFDGDNTATAIVNGEAHEIDLDARPGVFPLRGRFGGKGG